MSADATQSVVAETTPATPTPGGSSDLYAAALAAMEAQSQSEGGAADAVATPEPPKIDEPKAEEPPAEEAQTSDELAELRRQLDQRQARRHAKQQETALAEQVKTLTAQLEELRRSPRGPDPVALLNSDPVGALRQLGIDPVEFYGRFREAAKDPEKFRQQLGAKGATDELTAKIGAIEESLKADRLQREQAQAVAQRRQAERAFVAHTDDGTKYPHLSTFDPEERVAKGIAAAEYLWKAGYENVSDDVCARLAEETLKREYARLAAKMGGESKPMNPPGDGATDPKPGAQRASGTLSNQLAAQSTGATRKLSESERLQAAIRAMEAAERPQ